MLQYLIFDLDETLYPRRSGLMQAVSVRIDRYMVERMGMSPAQVSALRREYWERFGTTSRGLQILHHIDVDDYMEFVHNVPLRHYIGPDASLEAMLAALPQRKVVFTNATAAHARAVLDVLGVTRHFEAIYDSYFVGNESKPAVAGYQRLLDALHEPAERCLMIEDMGRNLRPARDLGMIGVLVDPRPGDDCTVAHYVIPAIHDLARVVREVDGG